MNLDKINEAVLTKALGGLTKFASSGAGQVAATGLSMIPNRAAQFSAGALWAAQPGLTGKIFGGMQMLGALKSQRRNQQQEGIIPNGKNVVSEFLNQGPVWQKR